MLVDENPDAVKESATEVTQIPAEALANPRALYLPQPESFWSSLEPRAVGSVLVMAAVVLGLGYGGWSLLKDSAMSALPFDSASR